MSPRQDSAPDRLTSYFRSDEKIRSRSVSRIVLSGMVDVPTPSARLLADWDREISSRMILEAGDVEPLPLARARVRWPDYGLCVQAADEWTSAQGLPGILAASDVALMACRGARYHHDGLQYGSAAFCNLFLSEDVGLDVHFPATGVRIPLRRGTVLIFDTCQPHGVIRRDRDSFNEADFPSDQDNVQIFLTWELPIGNPEVARSLGIEFDIIPPTALLHDEEQILLDDAPAMVCPASGRWHRSL
ncbi:hypothetical protein [Bordetella sp. LUAb4]|uniref:hypothetical protein n=1 Tax=Bordetella sp. LUAb4 TaxID=2843195 RepID=UPI001E2F5E18|nr:hypothetical protein [Bordetella sp. LUAb4]